MKAAIESGSGTEHLVVQEELPEEAYRNPTNFTGSQDQVTPSKPPIHVGGGRS